MMAAAAICTVCMQALKDREKILSGELTIRREIVQELVRLLANDVRSVSV